jgi:hypothetical protein
MSLALVPLAGASLLASRAMSVQTERPAHLNLLLAEIREQGDVRWGEPSSREVVFRVVVAGRPPCDARNADLEYTFLIDSDRSTATGMRVEPFGKLGLDARVSMTCDPARGAFTSRMGTVTVEPARERPGAFRVQLVTSVEKLPSLEFYWIAVARDGEALAKLPDTNDYGVWGILELALK